MKMSTYTTSIRNSNIRTIHTRLRVDMNCLLTCKTRKRILSDSLCNLCKSNDETVDHFLFKCKYFDDIRGQFINDVQKYIYPTFDSNHLLKFILDLQCPPEAIPLCCKLVYNMYTKREGVLGQSFMFLLNKMHVLLYYWQTFSDILKLDQER